MNEGLVFALSSLGHLYKQRNEILANAKKALSFWNRPRSAPFLRVSGLLVAAKAGKTHLCSQFKQSRDVAFIDIDAIADDMIYDAGQTAELKELKLCKTIRELIEVKKKTAKHIVLVSTDYQRMKRCGSQRCHLCYASPKFMDNLQKSRLDDDGKAKFQYSHSMLSFSVGKYFRTKCLCQISRCFIYDTVDELVDIVRSVYAIKPTN